MMRALLPDEETFKKAKILIELDNRINLQVSFENKRIPTIFNIKTNINC